ncbi:retrovirus-related pol polyprotein from transposon TNT 1-94, partial [Tanacetum coccineum]
MVDEFVDEGVPENEPKIGNEEVDLQKAMEESLKEFHSARQGPLPPVVIKEPKSGKFQPLPEVQGKGKEKVSDEQVALDLLTLQTPKKKSHADQFIFQRRTSMPTESSGHDESSSLYVELGLTDSESESDEEVSGIVASVQNEGQAGPNPGEHDEGQAGPNLGDAATSQPPSSHVENLKLPTEGEVRLEEPASSAGTLSSLQHLDKELSFADQFLVEKSQEDEPEKTNTESKRIGELEQHMADLVQANLALEERMDKHGSILYKLDNLNIPHQVSKAVDEIVTDTVDWAIQAPLKDRFKELPEADMKEILHHSMWKFNSYQAHEDHKQLYEALEKSMAHDHTDQLLTDLSEIRKKKKKRHDSPKTPPGSPPHQPPPPPPPVEPAWSIPSSDLHVPMNNWASTLASTYAYPPENSLLVHTGDMAIFMDWFCKKQGTTELKQQDLEGPAYEIVKVFHPNVIHLQYQMEECHKLLNDQVDESIIRPALSISKIKATYYPDVGLEQMVPDQMWIEEECKYDIAAMYDIFHWWFKRQRFYIDRHTSEGDRRAVRTHMRIISV